MKKKLLIPLLILILLLIALPSQLVAAQDSGDGVVHAVLFYSPTCPHCEYVITEVLPPLQEEYGDALDILLVDVTSVDGQELYRGLLDYYSVPDERRGVPTLLMAPDIILVGDGEIPERFPELISAGLAQGGVDWADLPGLASLLAEGTAEAPKKLTMGERFALDPAGNTVSVVVLLGMLVVLGLVTFNFQRPARKVTYPNWLIPALSVLGLLVAIYLSFIEMTQTEAICGPVGDCNTVQQSAYATLFGFLPVGVLGIIGYVFIFAAWATQTYGKEAWRPNATKALWLSSAFGTVFSVYLTFLEPFVIGATCMWCITSAVVQTAIFWLSSEPAKQYLVNKKTKRARRKKRPAKKKRKASKRRNRH